MRYCIEVNNHKAHYVSDLIQARQDAISVIETNRYILMARILADGDVHVGSVIHYTFGKMTDYMYVSEGMAYPLFTDGSIDTAYGHKDIPDGKAECFVQDHSVEYVVPMESLDRAIEFIVGIMKEHDVSYDGHVCSMDITADRTGWAYIGSVAKAKSIVPDVKLSYVFVTEGAVYEIRHNAPLKLLSPDDVIKYFGELKLEARPCPIE